MKNYLLLNSKSEDFKHLYINLIKIGATHRCLVRTPKILKNIVIIFCPINKIGQIKNFINKFISSEDCFFKIHGNRFGTKLTIG